MREQCHCPVLASTFDMPPETHLRLADLVLERAERLAEQQKDVVLIVDSLTRLSKTFTAAAAQAGKATLAADLEHMAALKADLARRLPQEVPGAKVVVQGQAPHILPITLPGYKSEVIVRFLSDRGICVSSGSACHKGKPSHVYAALKLPKKELDGVLRISFSYDTTPQDIDALLEGLKAAQEQLFTSLS